MRDLALGIDVGTSGVRAAALDGDGRRAAFAAAPMPAPLETNGWVTQDPAIWWDAARCALSALARQIDLERVGAIAVDGTSGTVVAVDANRRPVAPAQIAGHARKSFERLRRSLRRSRPPMAQLRRLRAPSISRVRQGWSGSFIRRIGFPGNFPGGSISLTKTMRSSPATIPLRDAGRIGLRKPACGPIVSRG